MWYFLDTSNLWIQIQSYLIPTGTAVVFRSYGVVSLIVLGLFIFINFYRKDVGFQPDLPPEEDPRQMAEEGTALAPHGVPANPMPRALSSQKLNEGAPDAGYGTYNATNGMLDIPGQRLAA